MNVHKKNLHGKTCSRHPRHFDFAAAKVEHQNLMRAVRSLRRDGHELAVNSNGQKLVKYTINFPQNLRKRTPIWRKQRTSTSRPPGDRVELQINRLPRPQEENSMPLPVCLSIVFSHHPGSISTMRRSETEKEREKEEISRNLPRPQIDDSSRVRFNSFSLSVLRR